MESYVRPRASYRCSADRTSLSWLTLPSKPLTDGLGNADGSENPYDNDGFQADSVCFQVIDPASLQITDEQKKRFHNAMAILNLNPCIRECELLSVDRGSPDPLQVPRPTVRGLGEGLHMYCKIRAEASKRVDDFAKTKWPKLLNLVATSANM